MRTFAIFVVMLLAASQAFATVTCDTPNATTGNYQADAVSEGCLQATTGLTVNTSEGSWNNAYIAWKISNQGGYYLYTYTWSASAKNLSHLILGVSRNCEDSTCIWGWDPNIVSIVFGTWKNTGESGSNPYLPSDLWGIKVDPVGESPSLTFSFQSNRVPVWQNFYAKDGNDGPVYAYNAGFSSTPGTPGYFVAAPDTVIPEPGFYGLLALGLAGLYLAVRRRTAH